MTNISSFVKIYTKKKRAAAQTQEAADTHLCHLQDWLDLFQFPVETM